VWLDDTKVFCQQWRNMELAEGPIL